MTRRKYYINKKCIKIGGSKNAKESNEKKKIFDNISKDQSFKMGSPKNEGVKKT